MLSLIFKTRRASTISAYIVPTNCGSTQVMCINATKDSKREAKKNSIIVNYIPCQKLITLSRTNTLYLMRNCSNSTGVKAASTGCINCNMEALEEAATKMYFIAQNNPKYIPLCIAELISLLLLFCIISIYIYKSNDFPTTRCHGSSVLIKNKNSDTLYFPLWIYERTLDRICMKILPLRPYYLIDTILKLCFMIANFINYKILQWKRNHTQEENSLR